STVSRNTTEAALTARTSHAHVPSGVMNQPCLRQLAAIADLACFLPSIEDFSACRRPYPGLAHDVLEDLLERSYSVRLARDPGVERQAQYAPALARGLCIQLVELIDDLIAIFILIMMIGDKHSIIVDVGGMRHGMDQTTIHLHDVRHVVVDPVT